jgi:hypothetical protein
LSRNLLDNKSAKWGEYPLTKHPFLPILSPFHGVLFR